MEGLCVPGVTWAVFVYKTVFVNLLDYLLDITALSELEAQAFRYTRINIW
jgi:hypothetical protein